jgi:trimethylamine--corrinoid protein Co-methyltransferase
MPAKPLLLSRAALFNRDQLERIEAGALRLLAEVGLAIRSDELTQRLRGRAYRWQGERVLLEPGTVREYLGVTRQRHGDQFSVEPLTPDPAPDLTLSTLCYSQYLHDPETDRLLPFTTERLIEATKLVHVAGEERVSRQVPGCPQDVPPDLATVVQCWVDATYCGSGFVGDVHTGRNLPYLMDVARVFGKEITGQVVYAVTPLTLGSEGLENVFTFEDRWQWTAVGNMASLGVTTPLAVADAFAFLAAEVIGAAVLLQDVTSIPTHFGLRLCPADLRTLFLTLGTPEDVLLQFANAEVNAFFQGTRWSPAVSGVHTMAKLPGAQSCGEKASQMTLGALLGARHFGLAGGLSLDEVFSPEQLIYDMELRDNVARLVAGLEIGDCDPERCVAEAWEALAGHGFASLDSTFDHYREVYWHPRLYERDLLMAWRQGGSVTIREKAQARARELVARHDFRLPDDQQREMDDILARAQAELS